MIKSMTGFGRAEYSDEKRNITVEIKTVNHRYGEYTVRMPRRYSYAEEKVKAAVKEIARRGKVEISIQVESLNGEETEIKLNLPAARKYRDSLLTLKKTLNLDGEITVDYIASLPDVLKSVPGAEDEDEFAAALMIPVKAAAEKLDQMRCIEGEKLQKDLFMRADLIKRYLDEIEERAPMVSVEYAAKLRARITELCEGAVEIPEDRILLEAAVFADKTNITEEIVRLNSHIDQLKDIITNSSQPDGKKLDFLIQEMNREANTIGSKANDLDLTSRVLDIKSEVEKIREQVQNIE